ncbi:hypothetical protein F2Q69_00007751 [Brassica cretica]|uniref:Uncharacterized protein n=1 Tax=Brassica cretica TaxID=69181 RepID=A0A8S9PDG3_BRACR|nr:hypothetical protein F2Q69_00007751 [Brassica cretica]
MCEMVCRLAWVPVMQPDIWEDWWRPVCVLAMLKDMWSTIGVAAHASRAIRSDTRAGTNLKLIGQSVPLMIKRKFCPELVQIHGFKSVKVLLDTPPGSPKNCPEAKGVQFIPVKSSHGFWPSLLRSTTGILRHIGQSPSCDVGFFSLRSFLGIVCRVLCRQQVRNQPMLGLFWGGLVYLRPRIQRVLTLSHKSGLGTGFGLVCIWFSLLEARSWQEAKSNLVTVTLGKDYRIAWCWTSGPPE